MDGLGDEREGGTGVGGFPEVPWRRWPAAVVVEEDRVSFFLWSPGVVLLWTRLLVVL